MSRPPELVAATFRVQGTVQGVGFRPFVYRLAHRLGIAGWVGNDADGVSIRAEGSPESLVRFQESLRAEAPQVRHREPDEAEVRHREPRANDQ